MENSLVSIESSLAKGGTTEPKRLKKKSGDERANTREMGAIDKMGGKPG